MFLLRHFLLLAFAAILHSTVITVGKTSKTIYNFSRLPSVLLSGNEHFRPTLRNVSVNCVNEDILFCCLIILYYRPPQKNR